MWPFAFDDDVPRSTTLRARARVLYDLLACCRGDFFTVKEAHFTPPVSVICDATQAWIDVRQANARCRLASNKLPAAIE
jgi:hypothetical protein